jgi:predicted dehydrogenase
MAKIAQLGLGYWGSNLLRNFLSLKDCEMLAACDLDPAMLAKARDKYPNLTLTSDFNSLLSDKEIDALIIATPGETHFKLAKQALSAGKHVFVEKPITLKTSEAEELIRLSDKVGKKLMVGHLLLYHPAVRKLKKVLNDGVIGKVGYLYFRRANFGKVRNFENVLWSLAPHDISVLLYLLDEKPTQCSAIGARCVQPDIEDVVFTSLRFADGKIAHLHNSWLDPRKEREIVVVGEKGMLILDEVSKDGKLKLIKKHISRTSGAGGFSYEDEGETIRKFEDVEPLKVECQHFIDCVKDGQQPLTDGKNGLDVLRVLAAAQSSLDNHGSLIGI